MVILVSISCCRCRCCCCCYFCTWLVIISAVRLSINRPKFSRSLNNNNNKKGGNSERVRHIFHFDKQASTSLDDCTKSKRRTPRTRNYVNANANVEDGLFENRLYWLIAHQISYEGKKFGYFFFAGMGWTKCLKFFARWSFFVVVVLVGFLSSSPSSSVLLFY